MTPAPILSRLGAATAALVPTLLGAFTWDTERGLSDFGRPPALAWCWLLTGLASALWILTRRSRRDVAAALTGLLLVAGLFGQAALPAPSGALLILACAALWAGAPWIRATRVNLASMSVLLLALPGALLSPYPMGALTWGATILPAIALVPLLPALFPGERARTPAILFVAGSSLLCAAALADYSALARTLGVGLFDLSATRLRPLALHPNLAVPSVVVALGVGAALQWTARGRVWPLALLNLVLVAALLAMGSKTGALAALAVLGLLLLLQVLERGRRLLALLAGFGVLLALVVPATGLTDDTITLRSDRMVSKAVSFRSAMWQLGREALAEAPWHGHGPRRTHVQGAFAPAGRYDGLPKDDHPHNVVLAVGNALGWPGLAGLLVLLLTSLGSGLAGATRGRALAGAAWAGGVVHWAANGVDMGGAVATLFPSGVLLLLALGEAARLPGPGVAPGPPPGRRAFVACVVAILAAGVVLTVEQTLVHRAASRFVSTLPGATPGSRPVGSGLLDAAARLVPFDPKHWLHRALLAERAGDTTLQIAAIERASAVDPGRGGSHHVLALLLARQDLADPGVAAHLEQALACDPRGPTASRVHLDRARLAGQQADAAVALAHLVQAVLLSSEVVRDLEHLPDPGLLRLTVDGTADVMIPTDRLLAEIRSRRQDLAGVDPAYDSRLRQREVELLQFLGRLDEADAASVDLLGESGLHLAMRRGGSAMARGDLAGAAEAYGEAAAGVHFGPLSFRLLCLAPIIDTAGSAFEDELAAALACLTDVTFETESVRRLLEARATVAGRRGQADLRARWERALAFIDR